MRYNLDGLPTQLTASTALLAKRAPANGAALLETLAARKRVTQDITLGKDDLRVGNMDGGQLTLAWQDCGAQRVSKSLTEELRILGGFSRKDFAYFVRESPSKIQAKLDAALEEFGYANKGFFVRTVDKQVRAILPASYKPLDNLEAATAFRDQAMKWRSRGVDVRIDCCEEECGELLLTACAPSLAAEVNVGDWLYAGIALANSECTSAATEVRPRIYRVVCANGAIAQETEAEGFAIEKLQQPTVMAKIGSFLGAQDAFGKKLESAFELAFRPERVEREAAIGRNAGNAMILNPYEHLAHLVASGLLTEDERDLARRLFEQQGDNSLYGLANAITAAAHGSRGNRQLRRSFGLEQLGGELARGEHGPPIGAPVYSR